MLKKDVILDRVYLKKVSGERTLVRVMATEGKGWNAINLKTNRLVYVKAASALTLVPESLVEKYIAIYCK